FMPDVRREFISRSAVPIAWPLAGQTLLPDIPLLELYSRRQGWGYDRDAALQRDARRACARARRARAQCSSCYAVFGGDPSYLGDCCRGSSLCECAPRRGFGPGLLLTDGLYRSVFWQHSRGHELVCKRARRRLLRISAARQHFDLRSSTRG